MGKKNKKQAYKPLYRSFEGLGNLVANISDEPGLIAKELKKFFLRHSLRQTASILLKRNRKTTRF
jgi:hypothetical protein